MLFGLGVPVSTGNFFVDLCLIGIVLYVVIRLAEGDK